MLRGVFLHPQGTERLRDILTIDAALGIVAACCRIIAAAARLVVAAVFKRPYRNALVLEELLEIANVCQEFVFLALQLLQVASPFRSACHPVGNIARDLLLGAVGASFCCGIATNFADL